MISKQQHKTILIAYSTILEDTAKSIADDIRSLNAAYKLFGNTVLDVQLIDATQASPEEYLHQETLASLCTIYITDEKLDHIYDRLSASDTPSTIDNKLFLFVPRSKSKSILYSIKDYQGQENSKFCINYSNEHHLKYVVYEQIWHMLGQPQEWLVTHDETSLFIGDTVQLDLVQIPFIRDNPNFSGNKARIEVLQKETKKLHEFILDYPDDEIFKRQLEEIEENIFHLRNEIKEELDLIFQQTESFTHLRATNINSDRLMQAIHDFNEGRIQSVLIKLEEVESDALSLLTFGKNASECAKSLQMHVKELRLKIATYLVDDRLPARERFNRAYACYELIHEIEIKSCFSAPEKLISQLDCAKLCRKHNRMNLAYAHFERALHINVHLLENGQVNNQQKHAYILGNLGKLRFITLDFCKAEQYFLESLRIREDLAHQLEAAFAPDFASILNNLGLLYLRKKQFKISEDYFERSFQAYKKLADLHADKYDPAIAKVLNNQGLLYSETLRHERAEQCYKRSLEIYQRLAEQRAVIFEPCCADVLNNLGRLYTDTRRYSEAQVFYKKCLSIAEKLAEQQSETFELSLAIHLKNLGNYYHSTLEFGCAEEHLLRALAITERLAAERPEAYHIYLANLLKDIGSLYMDTHQLKTAEAYILRSLAILEKLATAESSAFIPELARVLDELSALYCAGERMDEAELYHRRSWKIWEKLNSDEASVYCIDYLKCLINHIKIRMHTNDAQEAEQLCLRALSLYDKLEGKLQGLLLPYYATLYSMLGLLHHQVSRYDDAYQCYELSLECAEKISKDQSEVYTPSLAQLMEYIGDLFVDKHEYDRANLHYIRSLGMRESLAESHPRVFLSDLETILNKLGKLHQQNQQFEKAKKYFQRCLAICGELEEMQPDMYAIKLARIHSTLGAYYFYFSQFREAEEHFLRAQALFEHLNESKNDIYSSEHAVILESLERVYRESKQFDKADIYRQRFAHTYRDSGACEVTPLQEEPKNVRLDSKVNEADYRKILQKQLEEYLKNKGYPEDSIRPDCKITYNEFVADIAIMHNEELMEIYMLVIDFKDSNVPHYRETMETFLAKISVSLAYMNDEGKIETRIINPAASFSDYYSRFEEIIVEDSEYTYFFRGHDDHTYEIKPAIYRNVASVRGVDEEDILFKDSIRHSPEEYPEEMTTFEKLVKMQHYSLPTRLLDITTNPLVALFFACRSNEKSDAEVLIYKIAKKKVKYYDSDTVCILSNIAKCPSSFSSFDFELGSKCRNELHHQILHEKKHFKDEADKDDIQSVVCVLPKLGNIRIQKQSGAFFLYGVFGSSKAMAQLNIPPMRIGISKANKSKFLKSLAVLGIDESTLFPEIDNISQYIKRRQKHIVS